MKCAVIYGKKSGQHQYFIEAAKEYFDTVLGVPLENVRTVYDSEEGETRLMYRDTDLTEFDAAYVRFLGSDLMNAEHVLEVLEENNTYTQIDSDSLAIASNKFHMMKVLGDAGLPVPRSFYCLSTEEAERTGEKIGYPVVLKIVSGYGGKGVMKVSSASDISPITDTLTMFEQDLCIQEYIENPGEDTRITVIGDETFSFKRSAGDEDEFRSNVSAGGEVMGADPSGEMKESARRAATISGLDIAGIDLIETDEGFFIGEINACPGTEGVMEEFDENLAPPTMRYVKQRTLEYHS